MGWGEGGEGWEEGGADSGVVGWGEGGADRG